MLVYFIFCSLLVITAMWNGIARAARLTITALVFGHGPFDLNVSDLPWLEISWAWILCKMLPWSGPVLPKVCIFRFAVRVQVSRTLWIVCLAALAWHYKERSSENPIRFKICVVPPCIFQIMGDHATWDINNTNIKSIHGLQLLVASPGNFFIAASQGATRNPRWN